MAAEKSSSFLQDRVPTQEALSQMVSATHMSICIRINGLRGCICIIIIINNNKEKTEFGEEWHRRSLMVGERVGMI